MNRECSVPMEHQPKDPLTIDDKIEKAFALKSEGNDHFKANDLQSAIRKYHSALLYVKGLSSRRGTLEALGADCTLPEINEVTEEHKANIEELQILCYNNLAGISGTFKAIIQAVIVADETCLLPEHSCGGGDHRVVLFHFSPKKRQCKFT